LSEEITDLEIGEKLPLQSSQVISDIDLIRFFSQCLDRPAFQDSFHREGTMEAFDKAIEDTITAINTGSLRARDGQVLAQARGKAFLENPQWRERMDVIVDMLRALRARYADAVKGHEITLGIAQNGQRFYAIHSDSLGEWMDNTRYEIIVIFSGIYKEAGVPPLSFPRDVTQYGRYLGRF
jgi:hypothetical protein